MTKPPHGVGHVKEEEYIQYTVVSAPALSALSEFTDKRYPVSLLYFRISNLVIIFVYKRPEIPKRWLIKPQILWNANLTCLTKPPHGAGYVKKYKQLFFNVNFTPLYINLRTVYLIFHLPVSEWRNRWSKWRIWNNSAQVK